MRAVVAFVLNFNLALYFVTAQSIYQYHLPIESRHKSPFIFGSNTIFRERRDSESSDHHIIDATQDCMLVTSDEGHFFYKSVTDDSTVCGIYMITDPGKRIEMIFTYMDVPCEHEGLVAWIDGWELNKEFFPSASDHPHPMEDRFTELCGSRRVKQVFVSNQNVALLQYRIPVRGKGFSVTVRHIKNPSPCNILLHDVEDIYTLRNYGKSANCTLSAIFPASIRVIAMNVGVSSGHSSREIETGTISKCEKRGLTDYAVIGGSGGFDIANMEKVDSVCGLDSTPARFISSVFCGVTSVRLVSSGQFENSITIAVKKLDIEDVGRATLICQ